MTCSVLLISRQRALGESQVPEESGQQDKFVCRTLFPHRLQNYSAIHVGYTDLKKTPNLRTTYHTNGLQRQKV